MKANKRNIQHAESFHQNIKGLKMIDTAMNDKHKLLNKKKKRNEILQEPEESNKTYSDTNETTQGKKNNKKR